MSQSLVQIYLHVVFSTKNRISYLKDPQFRERMHAYLKGACDNSECPSICDGGAEDHVHILCLFSQNIKLRDFIKELKRQSSIWAKTQSVEYGAMLEEFSWQSGYGAFSVNPAHVKSVTEYIRDQAEHHKQETFQDEVRRLFKKYGVKYDERYVWD